jgi:thiol-disulfide isomerase/thioredoxin
MKNLLLAAALLLTAPAAVRAQEVGLPIGTKPPSVMVDDMAGRPVDLARYVGKTPVVIEFWATWCPSCKELEPTMLAVQKKYGPRVKILGVAVSFNQSPARVKLYAQKHKLPYEVLFDRTGKASEVYDVPATSYVVVLDRAGKVVYTGQGGEQNIDAAVRKAM